MFDTQNQSSMSNKQTRNILFWLFYFKIDKIKYINSTTFQIVDLNIDESAPLNQTRSNSTPHHLLPVRKSSFELSQQSSARSSPQQSLGLGPSSLNFTSGSISASGVSEATTTSLRPPNDHAMTISIPSFGGSLRRTKIVGKKMTFAIDRVFMLLLKAEDFNFSEIKVAIILYFCYKNPKIVVLTNCTKNRVLVFATYYSKAIKISSPHKMKRTSGDFCQFGAKKRFSA